jgi:hypothetical protein
MKQVSEIVITNKLKQGSPQTLFVSHKFVPLYKTLCIAWHVMCSLLAKLVSVGVPTGCWPLTATSRIHRHDNYEYWPLAILVSRAR